MEDSQKGERENSQTSGLLAKSAQELQEEVLSVQFCLKNNYYAPALSVKLRQKSLAGRHTLNPGLLIMKCQIEWIKMSYRLVKHHFGCASKRRLN